MQATLDRLLRSLDPEATVRIQEAAAVEDSQGTNVLRPDFIRPEDKPVFRAQPLHRRHLTSMPKSCADALGPLDPSSSGRHLASTLNLGGPLGVNEFPAWPGTMRSTRAGGVDVEMIRVY